MPRKERKAKERQKVRLTAEQKQECKEAFDLFDADGSGEIDENEMRMAMKQLGFDAKPSEVNKMIALADQDGDGVLNFEEFCIMVGPQMSEKETPMEIDRGFALIAGRAARAGIDGGSKEDQITLEDLRQVAREVFQFSGEEIREEQIRALIAEADQGDDEDDAGDGLVSLDEFRIVLRKAGVF
mmetsp:Transcript_2204/g.5134  ORF Transcript_2204/g.5134 Transcript_2204/m.5134 type:complete len:184 (-) Transcript_2204:129-680(-)